MQTAEKRMYYLTTLNPEVVTSSVAEDAKWAVNAIRLLASCVAACPARDYWKKLILSDARVRELLKGVK